MSRASRTLIRTLRTGMSLALALVMATYSFSMNSVAYAETTSDSVRTTQSFSDAPANKVESNETSATLSAANDVSANSAESRRTTVQLDANDSDERLANAEAKFGANKAATPDEDGQPTGISATDAVNDSLVSEVDSESLSGVFSNKIDGGVDGEIGTPSLLTSKLTAPLMAAAAPSLTTQASPTGSRAGTAYAVLDSAGTLTFFRSTTTYTAGTGKTVKDVMGKSYTGQIFTGVETNTSTSYTSAPWYSQRSSIKLAKIADGQVIAPKSCAGWFYYCSNMTAFEGADRLDTSVTASMYYMFYHCSKMTEPPLTSNWNTSAASNMGYMFAYCSAMTEPPSVGSWNTSKVTSIGNMFLSCSAMTEPPEVSGWDTSAMTDISSVFNNCRSITRWPTVSNWNTSKATTMSAIFFGCSKMTEPPAVGSWDTSKVTNMSSMFGTCSSMTEPPAVGSWDTSAVTNMSSMFNGCSSMTEPPAVSNWNTSKVTGMSSMFAKCLSMTEPPAVGSWDTSAVTGMGNMFQNCSSITEPPAVGHWNTSAVTIMYYMFHNCSSMIEPPAVSKWNTSAVTRMGSMFMDCSAMSSLDVSGWDFSKVASESDYLGLQNCLALRELKVPAGAKITSLPEHSAQDSYYATWGNIERGITGSTAADLVTTVNAGNGAGTWAWEFAGYTVNFVTDGSSTAMQSERIKPDEDYTVPSCEVVKLYHDFVEWSGSDGKRYHVGDIIPAGTFDIGERLTLTAMFEPHEYGPGESDDNLQITVPTSINLVARADGTLIGPSNAAIENHSTVGVHISSVDVDEQAPFKIVADAAASSSSNSIDIQFGPATDQLNAASYLAKTDVTDPSRWSMTAEGSSAASLGLQVGGHISNITEDITAQSKFGTIKWYLKVAA